MTSKLLGLAVTLGLPTMLAAQTPQIPNEHASDRGKAMGALHSQRAANRATHRRGDVVAVAHPRDPNAATAAVRATPPRSRPAVLPNDPPNGATPAAPPH